MMFRTLVFTLGLAIVASKQQPLEPLTKFRSFYARLKGESHEMFSHCECQGRRIEKPLMAAFVLVLMSTMLKLTR